MYYDDEIERKPTRFGDAIIGDPDNGQYSKQSICTGKQRVSAFPKKTNNEKTKNRSKDSEDIKKENIASGNNTCCLSDSLGDFVNDARQIRIVIEAFDNEEFVKELQEAVNNIGHDPNCIFPYHINTRMIHIDNGKLFIDKVKDYIVNTDGIFAILTLDANPVLKDGMTVIIDAHFSSIVTSRIELDDFIKNWFSYDIVRDTIRRFVEKHQTLPGGVSYNAFGKIFDENNGFDVKEPPNNIVKLTDDFNPFMVSAAEGHSKTILDQRKKEVINLLAKDNLLTPEIKEKILACTAVYDVNEIYEQTVIQPVEEERDISEQTKRHVQRYMKNLRNGNFDKEFNCSRRAEIGPGNPPDLSKEGILKARDEFGTAIENMDEILFGGQSENTSGTSRTRKNSNKENNK